jgi:hypothetical protein
VVRYRVHYHDSGRNADDHEDLAAESPEHAAFEVGGMWHEEYREDITLLRVEEIPE